MSKVESPAEMRWSTHRPELLGIAPMIYVAWSDGVLSDPELGALGDTLARQSWIDDELEAMVRSWLDPASPPPAAALASLRSWIRLCWPEDRPLTPPTLAGLGLELLRASGLTIGPWSDDSAPDGLAEAEAALGVNGPDAVRAVLGSRWERPSRPGEPLPESGGSRAGVARGLE